MGGGIADGERKQPLISLPRRRSGIRGKCAFKFYGCIPVGAKLRLGSPECFLCSKRGIELHGSLLDNADCSIRAGGNGGQCARLLSFLRLCRLAVLYNEYGKTSFCRTSRAVTDRSHRSRDPLSCS